MTLLPDFSIGQGDTLPALERTLTDEDGEPIDLTDATVAFSMKKPEAGSSVVTGAAELVDAAAGEVRYPWGDDDTAEAGTYDGHFVITDSAGKRRTWPAGSYLRIYVKPSLS